MEAYGTVDILFNNAGMLSTSSFMDITLEVCNNLWAVNVTSAMYLARLAAPVMKAKVKGIIINTGSVAGFDAHHGYVGYITTKHAMNGLSKSMAWELGPEIRVNAIAPGAIHTAMVDSIGGPEVIAGMKDGSPPKRIGQPMDVATVAMFHATDDSSFISGQIIRVDGGI